MMINNPKKFLESINSRDNSYKLRLQELANIENDSRNLYAVAISFQIGDIILEHKDFKKFNKSQNRYTYHPENLDIPVKAHYHVHPPRGDKELYAVNIDGTAHHKKNRGIQIPRKEADELRSLGVDIRTDRIIESYDFDFDNFNDGSIYVCFLLVSNDSQLLKG